MMMMIIIIIIIIIIIKVYTKISDYSYYKMGDN